MRYGVFLRAMNIGGNRLPVAALRERMGALGFTDVATHLQTGNVVRLEPTHDHQRIEDRPDDRHIADRLTDQLQRFKLLTKWTAGPVHPPDGAKLRHRTDGRLHEGRIGCSHARSLPDGPECLLKGLSARLQGRTFLPSRHSGPRA